MTFPLAPMDRPIQFFTYTLLMLPPVFFAIAVLSNPALLLPAMIILGIYAWVWFGFRPSHFIVHPHALEIVWPFERKQLERANIQSARVVTGGQLRHEVGFAARVGAGGLWGGFGWLWTKRRGMVRMYVSRIDRFVWIELVAGQPWLITPEDPERFVEALGFGAEGIADRGRARASEA